MTKYVVVRVRGEDDSEVNSNFRLLPVKIQAIQKLCVWYSELVVAATLNQVDSY